MSEPDHLHALLGDALAALPAGGTHGGLRERLENARRAEAAARRSFYLAKPHYGAFCPEGEPGRARASERSAVTSIRNGGSLLAFVFNRLYADALNKRKELGLTHFAMIHADVEAPPGWLDVLADEMDKVGADVVSAVLPIKDERGLTSTGCQDPETSAITRFTMTEVMALPETFDAAAACPGKYLMVNTGLWVMRFTEPWCEPPHFGGFEIRDCVVRLESGRFQPRVLPEDWNFSGWAARRGLKVFATRKIKALHHGGKAYGNDSAWGEWRTDKGDNF